MEKETISRINLSMCGGEIYGVPVAEGRVDEILTMATAVIHETLRKAPRQRWRFFRAAVRIMRDSRPEWIDRMAFYVLGSAVIFGLIYTFGNGLVAIARALGMW